MQATICDALRKVKPSDWNRLTGTENPFIRHEFLHALEASQSVGVDAGWVPQHLLIHDNGELVGAVPSYLKSHSYGEYVFDWAWADAYQRHGLRYFPKLVCTIPFTPAAGPRLLCAPAFDSLEFRQKMITAIIDLSNRINLSSVHFLFTNPTDNQALQENNLLIRMGCQYQWKNNDFRDFSDFLYSFNSKRRKEIKRERRRAQESGYDIQISMAKDVREEQWDTFYEYYCQTYDRKWGVPYLTRDFFRILSQNMADSVCLVTASLNGHLHAGAFCLLGTTTLYGRNWGCSSYQSSLHFEMCYYQTIEYCILNGLERFEAGAQGDYKINRGLMPTPTWSAHWIQNREFRKAIKKFLNEEQSSIERYIAHITNQSPFKSRG